MFQYGRRGILLATSFYKNFVIRKEGQNGVDFEEVGISQQQKGVLFQSFINFHYSVRPFIGIISMKIAFVVFKPGERRPHAPGFLELLQH